MQTVGVWRGNGNSVECLNAINNTAVILRQQGNGKMLMTNRRWRAAEPRVPMPSLVPTRLGAWGRRDLLCFSVRTIATLLRTSTSFITLFVPRAFWSAHLTPIFSCMIHKQYGKISARLAARRCQQASIRHGHIRCGQVAGNN